MCRMHSTVDDGVKYTSVSPMSLQSSKNQSFLELCALLMTTGKNENGRPKSMFFKVFGVPQLPITSINFL